MSDDESLPPWADDELSEILGMAEYNTRAAAHNLSEIYGLIARVHRAFVRAREAVQRDDDHLRLIPRFLLARASSSCLASIRLALGGQIFEAHVVLRAEIEQAWYALHIAEDPSPPARAEIWLRRNEDAAAVSRCKSEFSAGSVRSTHEAVDPGTAMDLQALYARTIDFGGHPNQLGLLSGLTKSKAGKTTTYQVPVLCADTLPMVTTLHAVAAVAIGVLKVFQAIFGIRFQLLDMDAEIRDLVDGLISIFKQYVPDAGGRGGA
jgi:hypothetical protein